MSDLAGDLGLSKGALYLYFPTKEALFLEVLRADLGAWFDAIEGALRKAVKRTPLSERLKSRSLAAQAIGAPQVTRSSTPPAT